MYLFLLSGENIRLAAGEVISLLRPSSYRLDGNLLIANTKAPPSLLRRLSLTKKVYRLLFTANNKNILIKAKSFSWPQYKSFSVRSSSIDEKALASVIWNKLKKPKVDLKNASAKIEVLGSKTLYCCLLLLEPPNNFSSRKPHLRPGFAPVSLSPKLARAMVNLTGARKGTILDPFCGTGGILIEAVLMNLNAEGSDSSDRMIMKARSNFSHYKLKGMFSVKDALTLSKKSPYIVSDLPYGQSSALSKNLYRDFIKTLDRILTKKAVISLPKPLSKNLLKGTSLRIEAEYRHYIHKSLTKHIVVLAKKL
jgi:tRNA (guanine10-N2)-dimethyltransferase